jgi:hypothetical protein
LAVFVSLEQSQVENLQNADGVEEKQNHKPAFLVISGGAPESVAFPE